MKMANNRVKSTNDLELKDRLVAINRVTKVTKGGRTFSFAAIVVVGNEDVDVIILRYFAGYTLTETAETLKIPQGTAATRQRRALKLLRLELEEEVSV